MGQQRNNGNVDKSEENEEGFFILLPVIITWATVCGFFVIICLLTYKYWNQRKEQQQQVKPLQFIQDEEDEVEEQKYADEKEEDVNVESLNEDRREVKKWLVVTVKLEIYFDLLIKHGYECMDFIKKITDKSELKSIGIIKKGHQTRMMKQINNLKRKKKKSINMHVPHANNNMYHEMKEEENESMYHKHESSQDFEPETLKETLTSGFNSDAMSGSIEMGKSAQHKRNFTVDTATSVVIPSNTSLH